MNPLAPALHDIPAEALTLHEVVFEGRGDGASSEPFSGESEAISAFLGAWAAKLGLKGDSALAERLGWEGVSLNAAARRLGVVLEGRRSGANPAGTGKEGRAGTLGELIRRRASEALRRTRIPDEIRGAAEGLESLFLSQMEERAWFWLPRFGKDDRVDLDKLPVLDRLIGQETAKCLESLLEMLIRWERDQDLLGAMLGGGRDSARLLGFQANQSEPHDGGRSVAILELEGGKVVYKPRTVRFEQEFYKLLGWLGEGTVPPVELPLIQAVDRGDYGWCEFIEHADFADEAAAADCFRKTGFLIAVAYCLGGVDLIRDNVIISGKGPVLVDAETMLQPLCCPAGAEEHSAEMLEQADQWRSHSVIETGALPIWSQDGHCERYSNIGLLGLPSWGGGDSGPLMTHQVSCRGEACQAADFLDEILDGFQLGCQRVLDARTALLDGPLSLASRFQGTRIRFLARPSGTYGQLFYRMMSPEALSSGLRFGLEAEVLLRTFLRLGRSGGAPPRWELTRREIAQVLALDVPRLELGAAEREEPWLLLSPVAYAETQLKSLDRDEMERQARLIRIGLSLSPPARVAELGAAPAPAGELELARQRLLELAGEIGERISRHSSLLAGLHSHRGYLPGEHLEQRIAGAALYGGRMGRALFFSELGRVTGEAAHSDSARREAREAAEDIVSRQWEEPLGCGGSGGLAGVLFGYRAILGDEADRGIEERWMSWLEGRLAEETSMEFDRGLAGTVMAALGASAGTRSGRMTELGIAAGERIWRLGAARGGAGPWSMESGGYHILGFAHGYAGVAAAFARLHGATGDIIWRERAEHVWTSLTSLLASARGGGFWAAAVSAEAGPLEGPEGSWCAGIPGLAMAKLEMLKAGILSAGDSVLADLESLDSADGLDFLCCGAAGQCWARMEESRFSGKDSTRLLREWLSRVDRDPLRIYQTGRTREECLLLPSSLFRGLSGIGLCHLRLACHDVVDVATLAIPSPGGQAG